MTVFHTVIFFYNNKQFMLLNLIIFINSHKVSHN